MKTNININIFIYVSINTIRGDDGNMEYRDLEVSCGDIHCEGKVIFDYSEFNEELLAKNNGEFYEMIPCNKCGSVHAVIPWVVLTLDEKNEEGFYEMTCDYYVQSQHIGSVGPLIEISADKVERPCPEGCGVNITFSTEYKKELLIQNNNEFYEAIKCDKCSYGFKTIPWLAVISVNDESRNQDGHYLFPAWVL